MDGSGRLWKSHKFFGSNEKFRQINVRLCRFIRRESLRQTKGNLNNSMWLLKPIHVHDLKILEIISNPAPFPPHSRSVLAFSSK